VAKAAPDRLRIARLERELADARRAGFACPKCGHGTFEERRVWRGGDQKRSHGELYCYWACASCATDVTTTVAPADGVPPPPAEVAPVTPPPTETVVLPVGAKGAR
jgi:hypothetical protein